MLLWKDEPWPQAHRTLMYYTCLLSVVVSPDFETRYFFLFKKLELLHTGKYLPLTQSPVLNCKLL